MTDEISAQLTAQIPLRLDQIVTRNCDRFQISLITDEEFDLLEQIDAPEWIYTVRQVHDWRLVGFHSSNGNGKSDVQFVLLGKVNDGNGIIPWMTSLVKGIDLKNRIVKTKNSYYGLEGNRQTDEPDLESILLLCHWLRGCGLGEYLGLVEVFY